MPLHSRRMALVRLLQKDSDESARSHNASVQNIYNVIGQSPDASDTNNNGNNRISVLTELVSNLCSTVQSLQQSVIMLCNKINVISRNVIPSEIDNITSDIQRRVCALKDKTQALVTIHVNILSMHKYVQGRTPFLPPLASSRVCFLNSF